MKDSLHLPLLQEKFPGKILLGVDEIAEIMNISKHHVYNLSSQKKLPFKCIDATKRVQVSIVELARYLDDDSYTKQPKSEPKGPEPLPIKKKRGRPRNSTRENY